MNENRAQVLLPSIVAGSSGRSVTGMSGSLSRARNQPFETYLTTDEGLRFGLFGKGSSLESRIRTLRDLRIPLVVELSGTLIEPHEVNAAAFVVVSDIRASTQAATPPMTSTAVPAASTPSPTPVATLDPQVQGVAIPLAIIRFNLVNLRSAPASTAAPSGRVLADTACDILGRNAANTWFKIDCIDGSEGWIDKRLVEVQGVAENLPVVDSANQETGDALVTPSPTLPATAATPTATPDAPVDRWRATYYNNGQLSGDPVYATSVETLDFDWGVSSPHISVSPLN